MPDSLIKQVADFLEQLSVHAGGTFQFIYTNEPHGLENEAITKWIAILSENTSWLTTAKSSR